MIWQDAVFTIGGILFIAFLIPTIRDERASVSRLTSIPSAFLLGIYAVTMWTLNMHVSTGVYVLSMAVWAYVAANKAPENIQPSAHATENSSTPASAAPADD